MDQSTRVASTVMILKGQGLTNGQMVEFTLEVGQETRCGVMEFTNGQMEEYTMVNITMAKRVAKDHLLGLMAEIIRASGYKVSNTGRGHLLMHKDK